MNEKDIALLVDEIETVDFREFWFGSALLERAANVRDVRVVRALAVRHHGLSNKEAFSAHVIRNAIKTADAPTFSLAWSIIDAENDTNRLVRGLDDFSYPPWAIAYVLGEIGGHGALRGAAVRLQPEHSARHYLVVRLISHLIVRYLKIRANKPPTMTMIDVNTGEMTRELPMSENSPTQKMEALRRSQADELFTPIAPAVIQDVRRSLSAVPSHLLNSPLADFLAALETLPTRHG